MVRLYIENPQGSVKNPEFDLDEITIGRASDNTIVLPDRNISRHHLRMSWDGNSWILEDAGSKYGTEYAEEPLDGPTKLIPQAYIVIGDYRIKLVSDSRMAKASQEKVSQMFVPEDQTRTKTEQFVAPQPEPQEEDLDGDLDWEEPEQTQKKSGKGLWIGLVVIVLILLGGGYAWLSGNSKKPKTENESSAKLQHPAPTPKPEKIKKPAPPPKKQVAMVQDAGTTAKSPDTTEPAPAKPVAQVHTDATQPRAQEPAKPTEKLASAQPVKIPKTTEKPKSAVKKVRGKAVKKQPHKKSKPKSVAVKKVRTKKRAPVATKTPAPVKKQESGNGASTMLQEAMGMSGSQQLKKLKACLAKYGNQCCRAHKYIANYYLGVGSTNHALTELKSFLSCTHSSREKLRTRRMINRLQGL